MESEENDNRSMNEINDSVPVVFYYPSVELTLECPECRHRSTLTFDVPLNREVKATCHKCHTKFILRPNTRNQYRKDINVFGKLSRRPIDVSKKKGHIDVRIQDMSVGGVGIIVLNNQMEKYRFEEGETLYFSFPLPKKGKEEYITVSGTVQSVIAMKKEKIWKVGVKFLEVDQGTQKKIGFFLL